MSSSYSFTGCYQFDSTSTIAGTLDAGELRDDEAEIPDPFDAGEIVIARTDNTIVEMFADRARSGEVTVACDGHADIYTAGPLGG